MSNLKEFPILNPFPAQYFDAPSESQPQWLRDISQNATDALKTFSVPTRKTESWKYSSRRLDLDACKASTSVATTDIAESFLLDGFRAVFNDGVLDETKSLLPTGSISLTPFSATNNDDRAIILKALQALQSDASYPFATMNTGQMTEGWFIRIGKKQIIDQPLTLVFNNTGATGGVHPRVVIEAEELSEATIVEEYTGVEGTTTLTNAVTQICLQRQAQLTYIRLNMEPETLQHIGLTTVECRRNSLFKSHCVGFGGKLRRHDLTVKLQEEGANTVMNGICITQGEQHYDNHTVIEHVAPHCDSEETYRSMAADESQSVFNGRILIHRDAQKSNANMSNKNLLLSTGAEIDTKPELEIYADDVKCAHGATIGQLDKEALFYLVSRGIGKEEAASMLSMGFINELVQRLPVEALKSVVLERITRFLKETFSQAGQ